LGFVEISLTVSYSWLFHTFSGAYLDRKQSETHGRVIVSADWLQQTKSRLPFNHWEIQRFRQMDDLDVSFLLPHLHQQALKSSDWMQNLVEDFVDKNDVVTYRRIDYAFRAEGGANEAGELPSSELTIITQASSNIIHKISDLAASGNTRISASVLYSSHIGLSHDLIRRLRVCWPDVRRLVDFHIVIRDCRDCGYADYSEDRKVSFAELVANAHGIFDIFSCSEIHQYGIGSLLQTELQSRRFGPKDTYPGNMLRKIASSLVRTKHGIVLDIDVVPSPNLYDSFRACRDSVVIGSSASERSDFGEKIVFVPPGLIIQLHLIISSFRSVALEIPVRTRPETKLQVRRLWERGVIRVR
jgi:hypothetical protein